MAMSDRREVLRQLLAGVLQAGGAAVVVLATGPVEAGTANQQDETPLPAEDPTVQPQPTPEELEQRIARVAGQADGVPPPSGEEDSWLNGGFRNVGLGGLGGGFRNVGVGGGLGGGAFRNVGLGGGGGFRNGAFNNGGWGGGGFRNVGVGGFPGGFHNAAFRNW